MAKKIRKPRAQKSSSKKKKPEPKHLVQRDGKFNTILHRCSHDKYRENPRELLKAEGFYDYEDEIIVGVKREKKVKAERNIKKRIKLIKDIIPKYKLEYENTKPPWKGVKNFVTGGPPYGNQAHHLLACELFYDNRWTADLLQIVKNTDYDINNERNVVYLPADYDHVKSRSCYFHNLPNHAFNHNPKYNDKVKVYTDEILNLAKKALKESEDGKCNIKTLDDILKMLQKIEDKFFEYIVNKGPGPMA